MFDYYRQYKDGEISGKVFRRRMAPIRLQVEAVLARAAQVKIKRLSGSCENILAHREALWTFVEWSQRTTTRRGNCAGSCSGADAASVRRASGETASPSAS